MSIYGKKLNRGEWAEFYVLLKLLGDGRLYSADRFMKKNLKSYLDIIRIIREEIKSGVLSYIVDKESGVVNIKDANDLITTISMSTFSYYANLLLSDISTKKGASIEVCSDVCDFAEMICVDSPKAAAVKSLKKQFGGKNDIFIEVRDPQSSIVSVMGFSIKSKFSSPPTLFNAGGTSQVLVKLSPFNDEMMHEFNNFIDSRGHRAWKACKNYIKTHGVSVQFVKPMHDIYADNLSLIRESMAEILGQCFIQARLGDVTGVKDVTEILMHNNPLKVRNTIIYEKSVKDFLMAGFTGMTAGRRWDGREQVNGGYIVVTDDGDVVCYHSNDREAFRDYLYSSTYFDYVDCKKYKWSYIFKHNKDFYLPLNSSVRFYKSL